MLTCIFELKAKLYGQKGKRGEKVKLVYQRHDPT